MNPLHNTYFFLFTGNTFITPEREENGLPFVDKEHPGLEGYRRRSIYRRSLEHTSYAYVTNQSCHFENGEIEFFSILQAWVLTNQDTLGSMDQTVRKMTTSPVKLANLHNTSPSYNLAPSPNAMPPNNGALASQAIPSFRSVPGNIQGKETCSDSTRNSEYHIPRLFLENSKLHAYLTNKVPNLIKLEERNYTLYEVRY